MSDFDNEIKNIDTDEIDINEPENEISESAEPVKPGREIVADNDNTFGKIGKKSNRSASRATVSFQFERIKTPEQLDVQSDLLPGKEDDTVDEHDSLLNRDVVKETDSVSDNESGFDFFHQGSKPEQDDQNSKNAEVVSEIFPSADPVSSIYKEKTEEKSTESGFKILGKKVRDLRQAAEEKREAAAAAKEEEKTKAEQDKLLAEIFSEPNKNIIGEVSDRDDLKKAHSISDDTGMANKKNSSKTSGSGSKKNVSKNGKKAVSAGKKASTAQSSQKKAAAGAAIKPSVNGQSEKKTPKPKKVKKKRNKVWAVVRGILLVFVTLGIVGCIAGGAYAAYVISKADTIHPDRIYEIIDVSSNIYDQNGDLVDEIYYTENRKIVEYDQLSDNLKNAFIAVEDKTFWTHNGLNIRRIFGAILERFKGGRISGTSTITQQLARNVFLPEEKDERTISRKIVEIYYAHEIEQTLSKEDILTAYLNTIYLGYGCYGIDTAARTYFNTSVEDLTLEQCAALAALPQAPDSYALLTNEEGEYTTEINDGLYANDRSEERRNLVLSLMEQQGYITAEEREAATKPISEFINPGSKSTSSNSAFKDYLIETVTADLMETYDLTKEQASKMLYTRGLKIYSTLATKTQAIITKEFSKDSNFPSAENGADVQAAMVIVEVGTGEIKAMVGSRDATGEMLFNRATNARQPGSSIKPLSVYSAALQKSYELEKEGKTWDIQDFDYDIQGALGWGDYITASSIVVDQKVTINGQAWPQNVTRSYSGTQTFRTALQKSINTCAVKILSQVGIEDSMSMLQNFGITTAVDDSSQATNDLNYAALGLGAMTEGVSPLEMACAYAAFPNGGVRNTPICYTRVEDSNGNVILEGKSESIKVMDEGVAWIMTDILKTVVSQGIAGNAAISGVSVGGKTGTTDDRADIWFDGFTPELSAALWIGTDKNERMNSGSEMASRLWSKIMGQLKRSTQGSYKEMPDNVVQKNGEYYTEGTEPSGGSSNYQSGVSEDGKTYIPSLIERINGWSSADQKKADKKLQDALKEAEEDEEDDDD